MKFSVRPSKGNKYCLALSGTISQNNYTSTCTIFSFLFSNSNREKFGVILENIKCFPSFDFVDLHCPLKLTSYRKFMIYIGVCLRISVFIFLLKVKKHS